MRGVTTRLCLLALLALGACADEQGRDSAAATAPAAAAGSAPPAAKLTPPPTSGVTAPAGLPTTVAPTTVPVPVPFVSVDVEIGPTSTVVAAPAVETDLPLDPFGTFAACSGLRDSVATWSLQVSDPGQDVTAVSILTGTDVAGPGTYDGTFRVEFVNGAALDGSGTVTLDPGLQSGTFAAADADLNGSFTCTGADAPAPVDAAVQVFALVRKGAAERVMSIAASAPAGECGDGVNVTGDAGVGALVELTIDAATVAIRVGTVDLPIDPAQTELHLDGGSGSFRAVTADGLTIDGAFTCS